MRAASDASAHEKRAACGGVHPELASKAVCMHGAMHIVTTGHPACMHITRPRMQARDKDRESNGDVPLRRTVHIELCPPASVTDIEVQQPTVSTTFVNDMRVPTRTTATASERRRRKSHPDEYSVLYNLANEPWRKYSWPFVVDRGFARNRCMALKLEGWVLYMETERCAASSHMCRRHACGPAPML